MSDTQHTKSGHRPIYQIATDIRADWQQPSSFARPYLEAMASLNDVTDNFFNDGARSVLAYFLSNAGSWRGDVARRIKAEIKQIISTKGAR